MRFFLIGMSVLLLSACGPDLSQEDKEGSEKFSQGLIKKISQTWTLENIDKEQLSDGAKIDDLNLKMVGLNVVAGPVKKISKANLRSSRKEDDGSGFVANWFRVECERDSPGVTVGLIKDENKWYLLSLKINSDKLNEFLQKQEEESKKVAENFMKEILTNFDSDYVKSQLGDGTFGNFKKDNYSFKAQFDELKEKHGKFKSIKDSKMTGYIALKGDRVYYYSMKVECEKDTVNSTINVVQVNNEWKIDYFDFGVKKLENVNKEEQTEAMQAAIEIARNFHSNYDVDYLKSKTCKATLAGFKKEKLDLKACVEVDSKMFGKYIEMKSEALGEPRVQDGKPVYSFIFEVKCENGIVNTTYFMMKEDGEWKLFDNSTFLADSSKDKKKNEDK